MTALRLYPRLSALLVLVLSPWWVIVTLFLTGGCGVASAPSDTSSAFEPHRYRQGPWFEGWYARSLDLGGKRSLAVIVGSFVAKGVHPEAGQALPGYIGILLSEGDGKPTRSWSVFPKETRTTVRGQPVTRDPWILSREDAPFAWEAPGFGSFQNQKIAISIPGEREITVSMELDEGTTWDRGGWPLGPESVGTALPLPLHWYVGSLRSPTRYEVAWKEADGSPQTWTGSGYTHLEKNWGAAFPKAWNWLQGLSLDQNGSGEAQVVVGGGTLTVLGVDLAAWLAGYRSPKESWNLRFSDPGVSITVDQDSCQGTFRLVAKRHDLEVEILARAPQGSFGPVAVPTSSGFVPNLGVESFSSYMTVSTYRPHLWGSRLTDQRVFRNAALEFGAGSYRQDCGRAAPAHPSLQGPSS